MGFDVRLKIHTFDFGRPSFFKNIACAMIMGAKGFYCEWDQTDRFWAGLTFGTLHKIKNVEIEIIVMPTVGGCSFRKLHDGIGYGTTTLNDIIVNGGLSFNFHRKFFASAAVIGWYAFHEHYSTDNHGEVKIESISRRQYYLIFSNSINSIGAPLCSTMATLTPSEGGFGSVIIFNLRFFISKSKSSTSNAI
jgi:hypothetical protein